MSYKKCMTSNSGRDAYNVVRVDKYWTVVGSFLFVSAIVIFHGSHQVLWKYQQENLYEAQNDLDIGTFVSDVETCQCGRPVQTSVIQSTCSHDADLRGYNQSVVSYTLFGHPNQDEVVLRRYFSNLEGRAGRIAKYYPGWIMRIYHNLTNSQVFSYLCPLRCRHRHMVDLCHVDQIRNEEINSALIHRLNPRMWRFLVMVDPLVDRFLSRDIDSDIIPREAAAVRQWLKSNYTFHVMRDHPSHGGFMLAGLWGAKNVQRRDLIRRLGKTMVWTSMNNHYQTDQNRLDVIVWPFATFDVMAHDSYFCNNWQLRFGAMVPTFPFPTQRVGHNYTGLDIVRTDIADHIISCPLDCRPAKHKDWLYC